MAVQTITREELREKLESGTGELVLVMPTDEWTYRSKHIPGTLNVNSLELADDMLGRNQHIVVYGPEEVRHDAAGFDFHELLDRNGYENVFFYEGGVADWEAAGYELDGVEIKDDEGAKEETGPKAVKPGRSTLPRTPGGTGSVGTTEMPGGE